MEVELNPGPVSFILLGIFLATDAIEVTDLKKPLMILILTWPLLGGRLCFCFLVGLVTVNSISAKIWGLQSRGVYQGKNKSMNCLISLLLLQGRKKKWNRVCFVLRTKLIKGVLGV